MQWNSIFPPMKFHYIAFAAHSHFSGVNRHRAHNQQISSFFFETRIMCIFMKNLSLYRADILLPLHLDICKCPLPTAECKMLQTGELEEVLLGVDYPSTLQVTPSGRLASSTVMV